jgi:hypothetical protein
VLVVPLVVESRSVGVLSLTNKRSGPFNDSDAELAIQVLSIMNQKLRASDRSVVSVCAEVADAEHDPRNGSRRCGYCLRF